MKRISVLKIIASVTRFLSVILIGLAMSLALLLIAQRIFTPFHVVLSDSMSPQISKGDAIVLKDIEPRDVKVGEVIVFRDPMDKEDFIIHRVVGVEEAGAAMLFTTKGDNNPVNDDWKISTGEVVGGVAVNVPRVGSFLDFVSTPRGYVSCIAIPGVVSLSLVFLLGIGETAGRNRLGRRRAELEHRRRRFNPGPTASRS